MSNKPKAQGNYNIASKHRDVVITSGMTPRENGVLIFKGKITDINDADTIRRVLRTAAGNALNAITSVLEDNERIDRILSFTCYINADENFSNHTEIADFASEFLKEELGPNGVGSRAAIGVSSLPSSAPVEIKLTASITSK